MKTLITTELAWRLRKYGNRLPADGNYEDEFVRAIAWKQNELLLEMDKLDRQLEEMAKNE